MLKASLMKGFSSGKSTSWTLIKYIFPITFFVSIIQYTPIFSWLMELITPLMGFIGLRPESAIPLVFGITMNLYAAIGAILSLELTVKEVFILATMLSFCHNIFIESAIAKSAGVKVWITLVIRFGLMIVSALVIQFFYTGGSQLAKMVGTTQETLELTGWSEILFYGLQSAISKVFVVICVVFPIVILVQLLKDYELFNYVVKLTKPLTKMLKMSDKTSATLTAGLLFGFIYGAGLIIQSVKEDSLTYRDVTLTFIFLSTAHAVLEDTFIFLPLGINVWWLLVIRVVAAIFLTILVATFWKEEQTKEGIQHEQKNQYGAI